MSGRMYRIGEAAALLGLKSYVLRFWETEFPQLEPVRTERGQRLYTEEHIDLLRLIRHLLHERGLTIDGARRILNSPDSRKVLHEDALSAASEFSSELFPGHNSGGESAADDDRFGDDEFDDSKFDDELDAAAADFISGWLSFLDEVIEELAEIRGLLAPLGDDSAESVCRDEGRGCAVNMLVEAGRSVAGSGESGVGKSEYDADEACPSAGKMEAASGAAVVAVEAEAGGGDSAGNATDGNKAFQAAGVGVSAQLEGEPRHSSHRTEFHYSGQETVSQSEAETTPAINSAAMSGSMLDHEVSSVVAVAMPDSAGGTADFIAPDTTAGQPDSPAVDTVESSALSDATAPAVPNGATIGVSLACAADSVSSDSAIASDGINITRDNSGLAGGGSTSSADAHVAFAEAEAVSSGTGPADGASGGIAAADPPLSQAFAGGTEPAPETGAPLHGSTAVAQNAGPTPGVGRLTPQTVALSDEPASLPERIAAWEISLAGSPVPASASVNLEAPLAQEYRELAVDHECAAASTPDKADVAFSSEPNGDEGDFSFSHDTHATETVLTSAFVSNPDYSGEPVSASIKAGKGGGDTDNATGLASLCSDSSGQFAAASALESASLPDFPGPSGVLPSHIGWATDTCKGDVREWSSAVTALGGDDCSHAGNRLISGDKADAEPLAPLSSVDLGVSGLKTDSLQVSEQAAAGPETSGSEVSELQVNALWSDDEDDDMGALEFEFSPAPDEERK